MRAEQTPNEKDIEAAKAYLRQRLSAELSMARNLGAAMRQAAIRIVSICYLANVTPRNFSFAALTSRAQREIDAVIEWLRETIDDYFQTLAVTSHDDDRDAILPAPESVFYDRLEDYCSKYKDELLLLIGAGMSLGVDSSTLGNSIGDNLKHPYDNSLVADAIEAPISDGRGRTNSMFTAIGNLTRFGIAEAWMLWWYVNGRRNGAVGWRVYRGSSFPCELCDSMVGFHADDSDLPPYHNSCKCFAAPIYP